MSIRCLRRDRTSLAAVAASLAVLSCLSAVENPPVDPIPIRFTARLAAADLQIERITAEPLGAEVRLTVGYTSGRERYLSLFDPPRGTVVKVLQRGALQPGAGQAVVLVPAEKLRAAPALTLRFSADERTDVNFVSLVLTDEAARPVFGHREAPAGPGRPDGVRRVLTQVADGADIRWCDVSAVVDLDRAKMAGLNFNEATRWSPAHAEIARELLQRGREPGLGVRSLHRAGLDGRGVAVGIIDQNLFPDHPEFKGRIVEYHDVGCNQTRGSMHGPAVLSLLAGRTIGTAPGAKVYYVAAPSWTKDARFEAEALDWLTERNRRLPPAERIRVVSVSAAPSGEGTPFTKNNKLWDAACERATQAGMLVLDCTAHRGIIGAGRYDPAAPDDITRVQTRFSGGNPALRARRIFAPMAGRTVAEEYERGQPGYQYDGGGGLSWAVPYAAGVLALGWQVDPRLSGEQMAELLRRTAYEREGRRFLDPVAFVKAVQAGAPAK